VVEGRAPERRELSRCRPGAGRSSSLLSGTYKTTITGKPAALNGKWRLEFLRRNVLHTVRNGTLVVTGKAVAIGPRRLRISDGSGPYACSTSEWNGVLLLQAFR